MNALVRIDGIRVASRTSAFRARKDGGDLPAIARAALRESRPRRQRADGGRPAARHRPTDRCRQRLPALVGALRPRGRTTSLRSRTRSPRASSTPSRRGSLRGRTRLPARPRPDEPRGLSELSEGPAPPRQGGPRRGPRRLRGGHPPGPVARAFVDRSRGDHRARVRLRRDPRARGVRHRERSPGDGEAVAGRVGRRPARGGVRGLDRTPLGGRGDRLAAGDRAPARPTFWPSPRSASSSVHARGSTRRCRSSSAHGKPIRSRPFPTASPETACSVAGGHRKRCATSRMRSPSRRRTPTPWTMRAWPRSSSAASTKASPRSSTWSRYPTAGPTSSARSAGRSRPPVGRPRPGRSSRSCELGRHRRPPVVSEAWLLGALGEADAAFAVIARAEEECMAYLYFTGLPGFDPLREDPRFGALVARLGLPSA